MSEPTIMNNKHVRDVRRDILHANTFRLFLKKRLTRTVERSLRFLMKSAFSKRPSPSPSSLLLLLLPRPLQCLVTLEDDRSSLFGVDLVVSKDALLANSFSREHFFTLGLRLSLSKLE